MAESELDFRGARGAERTRNLRQGLHSWFVLADDSTDVLIDAAERWKPKVTPTQHAPDSLALRLLIRSTQSMQGGLLMAERGMVTETRMLTRSLLENAYYLDALRQAPDETVKILINDEQAAARAQTSFAINAGLTTSPEQEARFAAIKDVMKGKSTKLGDVADKGEFKTAYLAYRLLSNNAVHTSITALQQHLRSEPGSPLKFTGGTDTTQNVAVALRYLILFAHTVGQSFAAMFSDETMQLQTTALGERFLKMPYSNLSTH